jgi:hypothetical protein
MAFAVDLTVNDDVSSIAYELMAFAVDSTINNDVSSLPMN